MTATALRKELEMVMALGGSAAPGAFVDALESPTVDLDEDWRDAFGNLRPGTPDSAAAYWHGVSSVLLTDFAHRKKCRWHHAYEIFPPDGLLANVVLPRLVRGDVSRLCLGALGFFGARKNLDALGDALLRPEAGPWRGLSVRDFVERVLLTGELSVSISARLFRNGAFWNLPGELGVVLGQLVLSHANKPVVAKTIREIPGPALERRLLAALAARTDGAGLDVLADRVAGGDLDASVIHESPHLFSRSQRAAYLAPFAPESPLAFVRRVLPQGMIGEIPCDSEAVSLVEPFLEQRGVEDHVNLRCAARPIVTFRDVFRHDALRRVIESVERDPVRRTKTAASSLSRTRGLFDSNAWVHAEEKEKLERAERAERARSASHLRRTLSARTKRSTGPGAPIRPVERFFGEGIEPEDDHYRVPTRTRPYESYARTVDPREPLVRELEDGLAQASREGVFRTADFPIEVLGEYDSGRNEAIVYRPMIRLCAATLATELAGADDPRLKQLAKSPDAVADALSLLVEVHEYSHGVAYWGADAEGSIFFDPEGAAVTLHELWAQVLTARFAERCEALGPRPLRALLDFVAARQPEPYRAYRLLDGLDRERTRDVLLRLRDGGERAPRPLAELTWDLARNVNAVLAVQSSHASAHLAELAAALQALVDADSPEAYLDACSTFLEAARPLALGHGELARRYPRPEEIPLHRLAQLIAWDPARYALYPGFTPFEHEQAAAEALERLGAFKKNHAYTTLPVLEKALAQAGLDQDKAIVGQPERPKRRYGGGGP